MTSFDCDVLVVGLGPTGATLAALLSQAGIRTIAIDKSPAVHPLPRAAHFDGEVMRIFQSLGLTEEILPHTRAVRYYDFVNGAKELLLRIDNDTIQTRSGWQPAFMFSQPDVERALRALLLSSATVETLPDRRFLSCVQSEDAVDASVEGPDGMTTLRARYLVGADGASSRVRDSIGVSLHDYHFDEPWLVVDVLVGRDTPVPDRALQVCDPRRPTTCTLMGPGRHRWEFMLLPGETPEAIAEPRSIARLLEPWGVGSDIEIERGAVYRFHGLVARAWRCGRVLLAGDSAHQMPPFAGQGMCAGVRDAANLSWKLSYVLNGTAHAALLDTYQTERAGQVQGIIQMAVEMGRVVCTLDPEAAARRDAAMLAERALGTQRPMDVLPGLGAGLFAQGTAQAAELFPQPWIHTRQGNARRLDDELGPRAWLIHTSDDIPRLASPFLDTFDLASARMLPFAPALSRWLADQNASAVLVRPDRYIFGTGRSDDLIRQFASSLGRPARVAAAPI